MATVLPDFEVVTASSGVARDDHYVTNEAGDTVRALRLEAARTNSLTRSEEFDHGDWVTSNSPTITADDAVAPDGTTTADKIAPMNGDSYVRQDNTVADDSLARVYSAYVEKGTGATAWVRIAYANGTTVLFPLGGKFDTDTGAIIDQSGLDDMQVVDHDENWWRVWVVLSNNSTGNTIIKTYLYPDANGSASTHFWGAQLEGVSGGASSPSSYIATTTAAVTRSGDDLSFSFTAAPQEMTVYAKFVERSPVQLQSNRHVALGDGSAPELLVLRNNDTNYAIFHATTGGNGQDSRTVNPSPGDVIELNGILYSDGDVQLDYSKNGGAVSTGTRTTTVSLSTAWSSETLSVNQDGGAPTRRGLADYIAIHVEAGVHTMDEMRGFVGTG